MRITADAHATVRVRVMLDGCSPSGLSVDPNLQFAAVKVEFRAEGWGLWPRICRGEGTHENLDPVRTRTGEEERRRHGRAIAPKIQAELKFLCRKDFSEEEVARAGEARGKKGLIGADSGRGKFDKQVPQAVV